MRGYFFVQQYGSYKPVFFVKNFMQIKHIVCRKAGRRNVAAATIAYEEKTKKTGTASHRYYSRCSIYPVCVRLHTL